MLLSIGSRLRFELDFFTRVRAIFARITEMQHAAAGRRAIARMDDRMLSDIGLSRADAAMEISRRPWDLTPKASKGLRGDT